METYLTRIGKYSLVRTDEGVRVWRKGKLLDTLPNEDEARAYIAKRGGVKIVSAAKKNPPKKGKGK